MCTSSFITYAATLLRDAIVNAEKCHGCGQHLHLCFPRALFSSADNNTKIKKLYIHKQIVQHKHTHRRQHFFAFPTCMSVCVYVFVYFSPKCLKKIVLAFLFVDFSNTTALKESPIQTYTNVVCLASFLNLRFFYFKRSCAASNTFHEFILFTNIN